VRREAIINMRHILMTALAGCGLLLTTMTASAQYQPRSWDQVQNEREMGNHGRMFDQIRADLDLASTTALPFSGDRDRVAIARDQLNQCQAAVNSGEFDRLTFGQTISAIQRVVDLNRLTDQDGHYLVNDMNQLRQLEAEVGS